MEQSSSECNSKEGASIVSADKDFLGKKRNKRSSKSKTNNSCSKHEASISGSTDVDLTHKHNQLQHNKSNNNTNNNESSTMSVPMQKTENLKVKETKVAGSSSKPPPENLIPKEIKLLTKETKVIIVGKPTSVEKPKNITTPAVVVAADTTEEVSSKQNSNTKCTLPKDPSLPGSEKQAFQPSSEPTFQPASEKPTFQPASEFHPASEKQTFEKITSPVEVTPEPPSSDVKKSVLAMGRLLEPRSIQPIATVPNNPWPKYIREIQRCLNSLDRLNDELNMNCDYAASEISDLFGEMQIALQNREHYLLLELETLRNTASALLAERWDLGTVLKKKVTRMNVFTPDSNRELQQEIQQYIADRKLDKDIANKCRFAANRRDGLNYAKNFGHVESILPTYTSLIMANSKLKADDVMVQEVPYSVMEVMPMETGYSETGWVNKQFLPLDLSSYGPYAAIMNPMKDLQVISLDQMMFLQPQPVVNPLPVKTQQASPKLEPAEPRKSTSDESDKEKEETKSTLEKVYSKLSAEELLVIQNRVRESLLKQGVKLYPPDGMEGELDDSKGKPLLTSAQREKKRQKRHRYRERKRLERRAEKMEQASDSSNSVVETASTQQQSDTKVTSSKHKKPSHKKDKSKSKSTSENEGSKSPPAKETEIIDLQSKVGSPAQVHSRTKMTKLPRKQINPDQGNVSQSSGNATDTTESLPKSRNSYAENTTSGEEPSILDDTNMSPACEATADTGQLVDKQKEPLANNKQDQTKLMPNTRNCNTEENTDT